jgi:hypothetical protein
MEIIKYEKLEPPVHAKLGDEIRLFIDNKMVHAKKIDHNKMEKYSCWACVEIPGAGIGYFVGNDNLLQELEKLCK